MTTPEPASQGRRDLKGARRAVGAAVAIAVVVIAAGYPVLGAIAIALCGLFVVSFLPWRLTTYGRPGDPLPLVVPYLVAVITFKIHVGEEYLTKIWEAISRIGQPMSEHTFVLVATTIAPIFWLLDLISLPAHRDRQLDDMGIRRRDGDRRDFPLRVPIYGTPAISAISPVSTRVCYPRPPAGTWPSGSTV